MTPTTKYTNVTTPIPGPQSKALLDEWHRYEADQTGYQAQVAIHHGEGAMLEDVDGNRFIDWTSGVLVANVGHAHPKLVKAVHEASARMLNIYEYCSEYRVRAAKALVQAAPAHLDTCFFLTVGSEATDSAMKIMKRHSGKFEIIGFHGGFHGRTMSTASAGGMAKPKRGFGPATPGVIRTPFPYCYRCPFKSQPDRCGFMCLDFLDDVVRANSTDSLAGLMVEPYLGTAGFIFPPEGWMPQLEKWIREKKILFALDEVQSSYGRTGKMWAMEWEGLTPDIVTVGKGIGSGIAASALLVRKAVMDRALGKGELGSTYGGNPVSCAAVIAVLDIMQSEKLVENAHAMGLIFKERLVGMVEKAAHLGDVRGRGLVWGLELVADKKTKEPAPALALKLIDSCARKGLLIGAVGNYGNVIRVAPPLVINEDQAHESLDIMQAALVSL
ncbi:MAG: aspartate aminotransferase family protein [Chloroflexi bacterium]|nr:aspartate aminotransferase family protein [Chloroflexota bacterium]